MTAPDPPVVRFGVFEVDLRAGELWKQGRLVRVQQQPFDVLRALLEQPGQLVTREALHKRLWPDGVTVDFDQSLNKALTKLRDALGDTADSPRFIETLPKRGYRFIADVQHSTPAGDAGAPVAVAVTSVPVAPAPQAPPPAAAARTASAPPAGAEPTAAGGWSMARWLPLAGLAVLLVALASVTSQDPVAGPLAGAARSSRPPLVSGSAAAQDFHERGRIAVAHRTPESLRTGIVNFERALAADARFAAAYVSLADAYGMLASDGVDDPRVAMPRSREAANRALTLDPGLATAHASLGRTTMLFDWDWAIAVWHFERARDLAPGYGIGRQWFASCYSAMALHAEAEREARAALALEPLSLPANTTLGYVLYMAKRYADAQAQLRRTLELDPGFAQARRVLGLALVLDGRPAEAIAEFERAAQLTAEAPASLADLAMARARTGDGAGARRLLTQLLDRQQRAEFVAPDGIAQVYWGLGEREAAVQWLQRAFEARVPAVAYLMADPLWDDLRGDPAVGAMIEGIKNGKAPAAPLP